MASCSTAGYGHRWWGDRRSLRILALALAASLSTLHAPAQGVAATSVVSGASADPPAFVPDWDGHTDATIVRYHLTRRSVVRVRILDARGRAVAAIDAGTRSAGTHELSWDGRGTNGRVQPAGTYRIRVDARPASQVGTSGSPDAAAMGGTIAVAGARAAAITLQDPPVTVKEVRLSRATIGRSGRSATTTVRFDLSTGSSISAAIVDGAGRVVSTLATGRMRAGTNTIAWNGRGTRGVAVADGEYSLVVAASGDGRPTATTRVPLRVDRTRPSMRATRRTRALVSAGGATIPLSIITGEDTTLIARLGRRSIRRALTAGSHKLSINVAELGLGASKRTRTVTLSLVLVDGAGNASASKVTVVVPPAPRAAPRPQRPAPTTPAPTTPVGGAPRVGILPWPVGGIVTSEFGMRGGRPHTGLDIAVPTGTPINPIAAGAVSFVGVLGGYGNLVIVEHLDGMRTYYAHMSRFGSFGVGDPVTPVDVLGFVGCTGSCTGPHVHFETRISDVPRDPRLYLTAR